MELDFAGVFFEFVRFKVGGGGDDVTLGGTVLEGGNTPDVGVGGGEHDDLESLGAEGLDGEELVNKVGETDAVTASDRGGGFGDDFRDDTQGVALAFELGVKGAVVRRFAFAHLLERQDRGPEFAYGSEHARGTVLSPAQVLIRAILTTRGGKFRVQCVPCSHRKSLPRGRALGDGTRDRSTGVPEVSKNTAYRS